MRKIKLTRGKYALVDDCDYAMVSQYNWCDNGSGYAVRNHLRADGKWRMQFMHRMICDADPGLMVDHRNRNKLDNRRCNLRPCTRSQNMANADGWSKHKGVRFRPEKIKWQARIKTKHLGYFDSQYAARRAYLRAARAIFGEFAH